MSKWFRLFDMCSGGREKTNYTTIYIEAPSEEIMAAIFTDKFDRDPYNTTCDCCGPDFSISDAVEGQTEEYDGETLRIPYPS